MKSLRVIGPAMLLVLTVWLVTAGAAHAASVKINGSTLEYDAGTIEENDVTIEQGLEPYAADSYLVTELGVKLNDDGDYINLTGGTNCHGRVDTEAPFGEITNADPTGPADTDGDTVDDTTVCTPAGAVTSISADVTDGADLEDDAIALGYDSEVTTDSTIVMGPGSDYVTGGLGVDEIDGGADDDTIYGGADDDRLTGGAGDDQLEGDEGDDTYLAGAGADGDDTLEDLGDEADSDTADYSARLTAVELSNDDADNDGNPATPESDNVGSDIEVLNGGSAGDTLIGNDLNDDVLRGNGGSDDMDGGGGSDTVDYANAPAAVTVDLSQDSGTGAGTDTLTDLENVNGSASGDDLTGSAESNEIFGNAGADTIMTRDSSSDSVDCGAATDSLISDTSDTDIACENVDDGTVVTPPASQPTPVSSAAPATASDRSAPKVSIASKSIKMAKNGSIKVKVSCPSDESSCSGSAMLAGKAQMGTAIFSGIPGGGSKQLTIKLTSKAKKQVKKKKKLAAKLKITARDSSGNAATAEIALTIKK